MLDLNKILEMIKQLTDSGGYGPCQLIAPISTPNAKKEKVGELFGLDIIADPNCPEETIFITEKEK